MGNRLLKESICTSEKIDSLSWLQEVAFYRLLVNCDDFGVMDARPKILRARLFPLKEDVSSSDLQEVLNALRRAGLIRIYEVDGKPYLQVLGWADHQRIRDSKHRYPTPDEAATAGNEEEEEEPGESPDSPEPEETSQTAECGDAQQDEASCGDLRQVAATCGEPRQDAADGGDLRLARAQNPNPNPNPNIYKRDYARVRARGTASDERFAAFWGEYPKRVAKQDAIKAWKKLNPDDELIARIQEGLRKWKTSDEWTRDGGRYIPYPATWLNGRRWDDEVRRASAGGSVPAQHYAQRDYSDREAEAIARMFEMNGGLE